MGGEQSTAGSVLSDKATSEDIHKVVNDKLIQHTKEINQDQTQIQKVTVNCTGGEQGLNAPFFKQKRQEFNWMGNIIKEEPVGMDYGCCPTVNQTAGMKLQAIESDSVESIDSMVNEVKSKLKHKADILDTDEEDKQTFIETINKSTDDIKNNIKDRLDNHLAQHGTVDQEIEFTVDYPLRCPVKEIDETTAVEILASDITSSILNTISKNHSEKETSQELEYSDTSFTPGVVLLLGLACSIFLGVIAYLVYKKMSDEGGSSASPASADGSGEGEGGDGSGEE